MYHSLRSLGLADKLGVVMAHTDSSTYSQQDYQRTLVILKILTESL
jgi:hypothetical protein